MNTALLRMSQCSRGLLLHELSCHYAFLARLIHLQHLLVDCSNVTLLDMALFAYPVLASVVYGIWLRLVVNTTRSVADPGDSDIIKSMLGDR
ncbi:hypothetical protein K7X08_027908 [Anisodus acutangulus]|uniref:Uncharacterized protein n=1 Tax=Anisodus acutangulus TaxID=402998 RepID=A0A9Q1MTR0_9SOLA|nr:hypothetical protein K7X08_027908 [Anisodus acutangulus]